MEYLPGLTVCREFGPRLPEDVLYEIFKLALPSIDVECPTYHGPVRHEVPMSLTQTCREWRGIAMRSPFFWNRIHFRVEETPKLRVYPSLELLEQNLRLTANVPLQVYAIGGYTSKNSLLIKTLLDMILPTFPRWEHAYISLPDVSFNRLEEYNVNRGADQLKSLFLSTLDVTERDESVLTAFLPVQLWNKATQLQHLAIHFSLETSGGPISRWNNAFHAHIPFNQLTFLEIGGADDESITVTELYSILSSCSNNLVTGRFCALQTSTLDKVVLNVMPPIQLPRLRNLLLGLCISDERKPATRIISLTQILDNFVRAPQLISLALHHDRRISPRLFRDFVEKSGCRSTLEELDLYNSLTQGVRFFRLLRALPSLKRLRRGLRNPTAFQEKFGTDIDDHFFDQLAVYNGESVGFKLCPLLEELTLDYYTALQSSSFRSGYLIRMITRRLGAAVVPRVGLHFTTLKLTRVPKGADIHPEIESLRKMYCEQFGLQLHLTSRSSYTNSRYLYARRTGTYDEEDGNDSEDETSLRLATWVPGDDSEEENDGENEW